MMPRRQDRHLIDRGPYSAIGYKKGNGGYAEHVPKLLYHHLAASMPEKTEEMKKRLFEVWKAIESEGPDDLGQGDLV